MQVLHLPKVQRRQGPPAADLRAARPGQQEDLEPRESSGDVEGGPSHQQTPPPEIIRGGQGIRQVRGAPWTQR